MSQILALTLPLPVLLALFALLLVSLVVGLVLATLRPAPVRLPLPAAESAATSERT